MHMTGLLYWLVFNLFYQIGTETYPCHSVKEPFSYLPFEHRPEPRIL